MQSLKGQLTLRGILVGCAGCIIITTASMYTALKLGMLPWPILFAAIISLFFLKFLGKTNLHEVNVTHTIMSAGAMVAGGIAFTIPGIWILGYSDGVSWWQMLIVALSGVVLGLVCTVYLRRHFVVTSELEYPLGEATAQTLIAGNSGGSVGKKLFSTMAFAGIYAVLRDWFGVLPTMFFNSYTIPGLSFGIYNSPMMLAVGFLVSTGAVVTWILGAVFANFGIIVGGTMLGFWDGSGGRALVSSLGMGVMMGCGVAIVVKAVIPTLKSLFKGLHEGETTGTFIGKLSSRFSAGIAACMIASVALVLCFALSLGPIPSFIIVVFVWVTCAMSAQSVGQTSIDPMEIFGLIVLPIVAFFADVSQIQLFFVAGVIAVACGLTGDLMNDFKAGHLLGTDVRAQGIGQTIGGVLGALIAVAVMVILVQAYGTENFGLNGTFVATQASVVATMISGIPSIPAFVFGLAAGFVMYLVGLPSMMVGLGIYLPFYLSFTAFFGLIVKLVFRFFKNRSRGNLAEAEAETRKKLGDESGIVEASGLLGGESVAGVLIALASIGLFLGS